MEFHGRTSAVPVWLYGVLYPVIVIPIGEAARRAGKTVLNMDKVQRQGMARFRRAFDTNARLGVVTLLFEAGNAYADGRSLEGDGEDSFDDLEDALEQFDQVIQAMSKETDTETEEADLAMESSQGLVAAHS